MQTFSGQLYAEMQERLNTIEADNMIGRAEAAYQMVKDILQKLKNFMQKYSFADEKEEIFFFKQVKPKFLKELIFYAELYHLEASKPVAGKKSIENYLKDTMASVRLYFERNLAFYNYCRTGKTHLDHLFFLRNAESTPFPPEYDLDRDAGFSTVHCFKLSRLLALESLKNYAEKGPDTLQQSQTPNIPGEVITDFQWTDPKAGLIELAYALQSKGALNHGNTEVKQVVALLENVFQISLGNYYGVFQQNIRIRKKNRTQYLDQLKERLEKRMDEEDENPRF